MQLAWIEGNDNYIVVNGCSTQYNNQNNASQELSTENMIFSHFGANVVSQHLLALPILSEDIFLIATTRAAFSIEPKTR